jgi:preprotein translocase SecE subunit
MGLAIYRKGQGKITRGVSAACLGLLLFIGCYQLYGFLVGFSWGQKPLFGFVIPIVEQPFNVGIIAATLVGVGVGGATYWFLNKKKAVDLLVDTETELKKVSWPSWPETLNSAIIVILAVAIIGVYLAIVDFFLGHFFGAVL